jgi:hypothetical protein
MRVGLAVAAVALAATGCSGGSEPPPHPTDFVSKATWTDAIWPFTVAEGLLTCHDPDRVTFTAEGVEYALNDAAKSTGEFPDITPVLRKGYVEINDERQPVKVPRGPMIDRGRDLCD